MKAFLLAMLLGMTASATAQRVPNLQDVQDLRQRLQTLQLTLEQKRRVMDLIRRERLQFYLNQKELNQILTDKQKALLLQWRRAREGNKKDTTTNSR